MSVASRRNRPADGSFDWAPNNQGASQGKALPAEMLPHEISFAGIRFKLAPADLGKANAVLRTSDDRFAARQIQSRLSAGGRG